MFKQIKIWSVLTFMLFACNENEQEVAPLSAKETDLLSSISEESTAMFDASFTDLNELFSSSSVSELETFDAKEFSKSSVLDYSKQSDFLSPYYEVIASVVNADNFSPAARASNESTFNEAEQQYVNTLTEAFSLLPDREVFGEEVKRIEDEIISNVSDEESRLKLLAISTSSTASVNYLFDNSEGIFAQFQEHAEQLNEENSHANGRMSCDPPNSPECQEGGGSSGDGSSCCFQGDFEWNWGRFGTNVVGGAAIGAGIAWVVNAVPVAGQAAYGSAIVGGAAGGGLTYTWNRFDDWMWSESSGGGSGDRESCGLFADPCNGQ